VDMSISCSNSRYIKFRIYVICMIIVYPVGKEISSMIFLQQEL